MTHTRLFTFTSLRRLLEQSGFRIAEIRGVPGPFPLAMGGSRLSRMLVRMNNALIAVSRGLFSYQILHGRCSRSPRSTTCCGRPGAIRDPGAEMSVEADARLAIAASSARTADALRFAPAARTAAKILVSVGLLVRIYPQGAACRSRRCGSAGRLGVDPLRLAAAVVAALRAGAALAADRRDARRRSSPFSAAITNVYIGQFFNQVLPSSVGGDAVRVWKLTRSCRCTRRFRASRSTASWRCSRCRSS